MDNTINNELQKPEVQITNQTKGFHYIYVISLLYVLSIYLVPVIVFTLTSKDIKIADKLFGIPVIIGIVNCIVSIKCCRPGNRIVLLNATVLIKYALIPFFIFNGCVSIILLLFTFVPVPFMIFVGPAGFILLSVVGWFVLVSGAPITISYLRVSAKEKLRPKAMVILHSLLQFFFVVDVIDVMVLTLKERKWKKLTITVIILLGIFILLMLILLVLAIIGILRR